MEEDPFGFLLPNPNPKPSLSQEEELQLCPFARQFEHFPDSDTQSTWNSSSPSPPPPGIVIASPPDTDPNEPPPEDDKFLTPPEHHPLIISSDSDDLTSAPTSDVTTICVGDELALVDLGAEGNVELEIQVCEEDDCDCVIKDHEKEDDVLGGVIVSKDITTEFTLEIDEVSLQLSVDTENVDTEIINLQSEGTIVCCGDDETEFVDDDMEVESRVDLEMEGNLEAEQCDNVEITEVVGCEFDKVGVLDGEIMSNKIEVCEEEMELGVVTGCVEKMSNVVMDFEERGVEIKLGNEKLVTRLDFDENDPCEGDKVSKRNVLDDNVGDDRGLNVLSRGENELVDCEVRGYGNVKDCCKDINGIEDVGPKEDVNLKRSGKRKLPGRKRMLEGSDKIKTGKSKEDIEKFKFVKPSDGADKGGKGGNRRGIDEGVSEEGNVLSSKIGKGTLNKVGHGSVGKGRSSFLDLVYKASELLKSEMVDDSEVDILEVAKKKGLKLPRPSWWPPEGFN